MPNTNLELKSRVKESIDNLVINVQNYVGLATKKYELLHETADNITRLKNIIGALTYLGAYDFTKSDITQQQLTDYVVDMLKVQPQKGDTIINLFDSVEWWYSGEEWVNIGSATVTFATNETPGIVRGSDGKFRIFIDAEGEMIVNGLQTIEDVVHDIDLKLNNLIHDINVSLGSINEMLVSEYINDFGISSLIPQMKPVFEHWSNATNKNQQMTITLKATENIPANRCVTALGNLAHSSTNGRIPIGVVEKAYQNGEDMEVIIKGVVEIEANSTVTTGYALYVNGSDGTVRNQIGVHYISYAYLEGIQMIALASGSANQKIKTLLL